MADSLGQMAKRIRQQSGGLVSPTLAMQWLRDRYRQAIDGIDDMWSWQLGFGNFYAHQSIVGTCTVTQGSNLVTNVVLPPSALPLPGDRTTVVGRQALFQGMQPVFSVVDNQDAATFVIDQGWPAATGTVPFEITNVYFTPDANHADFERLICFLDPANGVQLPWSFTVEAINNIDAQRSSAGDSFLLADADWSESYFSALPSDVVDSFGFTAASDPLPRRELYPRQQAGHSYTYLFKRRMADLINPDDTPKGLMAGRGDILIEGALADLALWEGPPAMQKAANPIGYNIHQQRYDQLIVDLHILDQSISQRSFKTILDYTRMPYPAAFLSSRFAQLHPSISADSGAADLLTAGFGEEIY